MLDKRTVLGVALVASAAPSLAAQSYSDLTLVRNRKNEGQDVLQVRAGAGIGFPSGAEDESIGLQSVVAPHGSVYFRKRGFTAERAVLLAYAGFDGVYATVKDDPELGSQAQSRLELFGRFFPYYREGFFRDDEFVPTGRYEGNDYGAALATSRQVDQEFRIELGLFYRRHDFSTNETTAPTYTIPDDFNAFGGRLVLEHQTLTIDRETGRPDGGFLLSAAVEREQNDSALRFGTQGIYESELPSGLWRGRGHLEWYFPHSEASTIAIYLDASYSAESDRVYNYDATKPLGNLWADGQLRWRLDIGRALSITPFVSGQYVRILEESGLSADTKVFFGGGLDARFEASTNLALFVNYSYLNNENRPTVSPTRDTLGEHQLFTGIELRW